MSAEEAFLGDAILEAIVPEASNTTIADAIATEHETDDSESILPSVKQRDLLFFGMSSSTLRLRASSYSFLDS